MASAFTKIISGEAPAYKIAETKDYLSFLDINPLVPGHCLVIPKQEINVIFDMDDEQYIGLLLFAKAVAKAIHKTVPSTKVGMAVIGIEVPHVHIHLVPINAVEDMDFKHKERTKLTDQECKDLAEKIHANL